MDGASPAEDDVADVDSAWAEDDNPLNDPEERQVLFAALDSYRQYRKNAHYATTHRRRQNVYALPQEQWKLLAAPPFNLLDTLSQIDDAIDVNADLADAILDVGLHSMSFEITPSSTGLPVWHDKAKPSDHTKAQSTIRQFYRDWSAPGFEREVKPILDLIVADLHLRFPPSSHASILLPGAGLGRLLFELTLAGYHTTGNEISYHQLLASNFILNHTTAANAYTTHPFLSTFTNNLTRTAQLSAFSIPDIHPSTTLATAVSQGKQIGSMVMTAGDFIPSYSAPDQTSTFDVILTVYFIDTSPNLIRYIRTVQNALKLGGLWINIGPLLWHFDNQSPASSAKHASANHRHTNGATDSHADQEDRWEDSGIAEPGGFELSNEEVVLLVQQFGFTIEKSETNLDTEKFGGYMQDPQSMMQNLYRPVHWVARKTR